MCALDPLLHIPRIEYVEEIYEYVLNQPAVFSLVILDMTNFHLVNDIYGYDVGDVVIESFIQTLRQRLPPGGISLRFRHGDEFLFFLPWAKTATVSHFETFREGYETKPARTLSGGEEIYVSYRFAVLELTRASQPIATLLLEAEKALRQIKKQGSVRS